MLGLVLAAGVALSHSNAPAQGPFTFYLVAEPSTIFGSNSQRLGEVSRDIEQSWHGHIAIPRSGADKLRVVDVAPDCTQAYNHCIAVFVGVGTSTGTARLAPSGAAIPGRRLHAFGTESVRQYAYVSIGVALSDINVDEFADECGALGLRSFAMYPACTAELLVAHGERTLEIAETAPYRLAAKCADRLSEFLGATDLSVMHKSTVLEVSAASFLELAIWSRSLRRIHVTLHDSTRGAAAVLVLQPGETGCRFGVAAPNQNMEKQIPMLMQHRHVLVRTSFTPTNGTALPSKIYAFPIDPDGKVRVESQHCDVRRPGKGAARRHMIGNCLMMPQDLRPRVASLCTRGLTGVAVEQYAVSVTALSQALAKPVTIHGSPATQCSTHDNHTVCRPANFMPVGDVSVSILLTETQWRKVSAP